MGGMGMCRAGNKTQHIKGAEGGEGGPAVPGSSRVQLGEERAKLGEGGTGGDMRGEFSSLEAFSGAGCLGKPLEKLWEAAAEQGLQGAGARVLWSHCCMWDDVLGFQLLNFSSICNPAIL